MHPFFKVSRRTEPKHEFELPKSQGGVVFRPSGSNHVSLFNPDFIPATLETYDKLYIEKLIEFGIQNMDNAISFMDLHRKNGPGQPNKYLNYVSELLEDFEEDFNTYRELYQIAVRWIKDQKRVTVQDLTFDEILKNPEDNNMIINKCQHKQFVDDQGRWMQKKMYLVALSLWLMRAGYFHKKEYSKAVLQRVFTKEFKITVSDKSFRNEPALKYFEDFKEIFPVK